MELDHYEATSTFTSVTTQIVAHPAIRGFVDGLQKATFPSPPAILATGLPAFTLAGLSPASACGPSLGTQLLKPDPIHDIKVIRSSIVQSFMNSLGIVKEKVLG